MNFIYKLPENERRLIFAKVLGIDYSQTYKLDFLSKNGLSPGILNKENQIEKIAKKRLNGKPLQYILQEVNFLDLVLKIKPGVFIPRPETEYMTDCFLKDIKIANDKNLQILDICSGSGAISLAVAKYCSQLASKQNGEFFDYKIVGLESSKKAVRLANKNKRFLNLDDVKFIKYAFPKNLKQILNKKMAQVIYQADYIISNPPYIPENSAISGLVSEEVLAYEPYEALFAGPDGTNLAKNIIYQANLGKCKILYIECHETNAYILAEFAKKMLPKKFNFVQVIKDLAGKNRFIVCKK
ncbi:MAG: peptide chain release factor N(5)-glutamine methyltransferase [Bifidobacteriaceae bacterium]|jgi:release factor glutamine methyltransferase|nr:peptide chain release factor N(5)-glutamine methyltransferase [Bifidobacteriaceae bacterium]